MFWFRVDGFDWFDVVCFVFGCLCYSDVVRLRIRCVAVISGDCLLFALLVDGDLYVCFVLIACGIDLCY